LEAHIARQRCRFETTPFSKKIPKVIGIDKLKFLQILVFTKGTTSLQNLSWQEVLTYDKSSNLTKAPNNHGSYVSPGL
jgi:hypothetical protein